MPRNSSDLAIDTKDAARLCYAKKATFCFTGVSNKRSSGMIIDIPADVFLQPSAKFLTFNSIRVVTGLIMFLDEKLRFGRQPRTSAEGKLQTVTLLSLAQNAKTTSAMEKKRVECQNATGLAKNKVRLANKPACQASAELSQGLQMASCAANSSAAREVLHDGCWTTNLSFWKATKRLKHTGRSNRL